MGERLQVELLQASECAIALRECGEDEDLKRVPRALDQLQRAPMPCRVRVDQRVVEDDELRLGPEAPRGQQTPKCKPQGEQGLLLRSPGEAVQRPQAG